jgi:energy-coupling factor transporter ATP-binding protein EcfA2
MIERLYVNNFRCLENFSIDFNGRDSVLIIGRNGSGKSTIRDALGVFQAICRGINRAPDLIAESDFAQGRTQIPMRFELEVALAGKGFKYAVSFEMSENFREPRIADEELSVDGKTMFSRRPEQVIFSGKQAIDFNSRFPVLPLINERPGAGSIQEFRSFLASMVLIAPVPAGMSGFSEEESVELRGDASNFASWFNALLSRFPAAYGVLHEYLKSLCLILILSRTCRAARRASSSWSSSRKRNQIGFCQSISDNSPTAKSASSSVP